MQKKLTLRALYFDRSGQTESVMYIYGEFEKNGETYTVEGLAAMYFDKELTDEEWTGDTPDSFDTDSGSGSWQDSYGSDDKSCTRCVGSGEVECSWCDGSGEEECNVCDGDGGSYRIDTSVPNYNGVDGTVDYKWHECSSCGGDGEDDCHRCYGKGTVDCPAC